MLIHEIKFGTPYFDELIRIRKAVLWDPLGLDFSETEISQEYRNYHLAVFDDDFVMIGGLSLEWGRGHCMKVEHVVVSGEFQKTGIGTRLIGSAEKFAKHLGAKTMTLYAWEEAVGFYDKLGFRKYGKPFKEEGIYHYEMRKKL